jgi:hypothetical protein
MSTALQAARKAREENGTEYLNPQEKFERKATRKTAIDAKCFDCIGGGYDLGWRWSIGNCVSPDCSLYPFRPFQGMFGKAAPKFMKQEEK